MPSPDVEMLREVLEFINEIMPTPPPFPELNPVPYLSLPGEILEAVKDLGVANQEIADMEWIEARRPFMSQGELTHTERVATTVRDIGRNDQLAPAHLDMTEAFGYIISMIDWEERHGPLASLKVLATSPVERGLYRLYFGGDDDTIVEMRTM
ncbi:hypothetical protein B0H67DRAFT_683676 [Lasiosphaeris hirsuta]|uniref:Uncharacterized protein n=1 Tax=Lasiosphaeris hirsuta TaxID=260670 RepID=A0AA40DTC7_9PEZI|nr:hypothetical protein B0H67DRAFT_683676 [Lasiosphaeris hirsuta]